MFALSVIAGILVLVELMWREKMIERENGRVIIHIAVATWVAGWPWLLPFQTISYIALAMFVVISLSRGLNVLQSIHKTKRWTVGELLFPIGIFLCSVLTNEPLIFAAAMLTLGIGDGAASIIGHKLNFIPYKVLGQKKSVGGTVTFMVVAGVISVLALHQLRVEPATIALGAVLTALVTAAAENVSVFGSDDITVPLTTLFLLAQFA